MCCAAFYKWMNLIFYRHVVTRILKQCGWALVAICFAATQALAQEYCMDGRFDTAIFDSTQTEKLIGIQYGSAVDYSGAEQILTLDIFRPLPSEDTLEKKPLVLFVHGGGLVGGAKESLFSDFLGKRFSQRGYVFASINYRLGWDNPGGCLGDTLSLQLAMYRAIQDTKAAIRFLMEYSDTYSIDTNYIFLAGNSVGSTLILNAAYAKQENFYPYQYEALGSIDSSTNAYFNHAIAIRGIMAMAAGTDTTTLFDNAVIPTIFFHGTCDSIVPYTTGPLYNCTSPNSYLFFHGSRSLADAFDARNIPYWLYTNAGLGHEAAGYDTAFTYTSVFFKEILCNTTATREVYRIINTECKPLRNEVYNIAPNPFHDQFNISVLVKTSGDLQVQLFNVLGQQVMYRTFHVERLNSRLVIDVGDAGLANGYYILLVQWSSKVWKIPLIKS